MRLLLIALSTVTLAACGSEVEGTEQDKTGYDKGRGQGYDDGSAESF